MVTIASRLLLLLLFLEAYRTYFVLWAESPNLPGAFTADYAQLGRELRAMPDSVPKYVILIPRGLSTPLSDPWNGNKVHDLPIFAQPILFMTDTFSPERQVQHNV